MAFYGVGIDAEVIRLIVEIKLKLANKYGAFGIRQLDLAFKNYDRDRRGHLDAEEFVGILNALGIFVRQIDYQALTKYFGKGLPGIDYTAFVDRFREPLCPKKEQLVRQVFDKLDVNRSGYLDPSEIGSPVLTQHTCTNRTRTSTS